MYLCRYICVPYTRVVALYIPYSYTQQFLTNFTNIANYHCEATLNDMHNDHCEVKA